MWNLVVMAIVVLAILGLAITVFLRGRARCVTERDEILLTDFVSTYADPVSSGTLEESAWPWTWSSRPMRMSTLSEGPADSQFMGRTPDRAHHRRRRPRNLPACRHQGHAQRLHRQPRQPSTHHAGRGQCRARGESLAREKSRHRAGIVLNSLHQSGLRVARKAGASRWPSCRSTTSRCRKRLHRLWMPQGIRPGRPRTSRRSELFRLPLYQHAVELDPNFAMAYARLGTIYSNLVQSELASKTGKSLELRDRASEHEKSASCRTTTSNSGQLEKGITALELYKQTYPRFDSVRQPGGGLHRDGQVNALDNARKAVQLDPDSASWIFERCLCLRRSEPAGRGRGHFQPGPAAQGRRGDCDSSSPRLPGCRVTRPAWSANWTRLKNDPQSEFTEPGCDLRWRPTAVSSARRGPSTEAADAAQRRRLHGGCGERIFAGEPAWNALRDQGCTRR